VKVTAKADYAVRAVLELATVDNGLVKGERIARAQGIPLKFLENILIEVARRADLLDRAVVDHHDLLGHLHRLLLVVGDEHGRHVDRVVEASQPGAQLLSHGGVERAEGLVEQQHARLDGERPGQRHALALATRELRGVAMGEAVEVDEPEQLVDAGLDLLLGPLADRQPEGHVLGHRHVLEGGVVLEHEPHVAALRRRAGGVLAANPHGAGVRLLEPGDHPQQRGLAAPARAEQRGERPVADLERHLVQGDEVAEALRDRVDDDAHVRASLGLITFMASSVARASRARTTEAA